MAEIDTSELVKALLRPVAYPHHPDQVEMAQTQMSFVFLAGPYVYKVKKPVNLGYLDYTTLEKRRFFCRQEVKLNRRLCPGTYLGVVGITQRQGRVVVESRGKALEYAVKMLLLPPERMMDRLLEQGQVTEDMVRQVAEKMARFHRRARIGPEISAFGGLDMQRTNTEENFSQTERYVDLALSQKVYQAIMDYTRHFLAEKAHLFQQRIDQGRVRDCHGDLHAAHVCFTDGLCIYDCIEFNDRFRYCDVASEIAFLAMDLDFHGRGDLSLAFTGAYMEAAGDRGLGGLLSFYKCYRACVRGKVECFRLDDLHIPPPEKETALERARRYFALAHWYSCEHPRLIITTGMVGTGKSALAEALGRRLGMRVISSDIVRKGLAGISPTEHRFEEFDTGIYSSDFSRRTYQAMLQEAERSLAAGDSVILDATFRRTAERRWAGEMAQKAGAKFSVIQTTCPEEVVRARLEKRLRDGSPSDGRWEIYLVQKDDFDLLEEPYIVADTSRPLAEVVEEVVASLGSNIEPNGSARVE